MKKGQFGRRLAELRKHRGLTQKELAEKTQDGHRPISARTVSGLEQGRSEPSFAIAVALAEALSVPIESFVVAPTSDGNAGPGRPKADEEE